MPDVTTMPLDAITPYEGNPRIIPQEAVDRVKASIQTYGFQAPIIVDHRGVIIVGHTRYKALQELGHTEARVIVSNLTDEDADQYRIVDNRAGEFATWDRDLLIPELRTFVNTQHIELLFPDIDLAEDGVELERQINEVDLERAQQSMDKRLRDNRNLKYREISCPNCGGIIRLSS